MLSIKPELRYLGGVECTPSPGKKTGIPHEQCSGQEGQKGEPGKGYSLGTLA